MRDGLDWEKLEEWSMSVDTSELIGFWGPMGVGVSFRKSGTALECDRMPADPRHRAMFERVLKARARDILLYIDSGGVSSEVPTPENAVRKAESLLRPEDE